MSKKEGAAAPLRAVPEGGGDAVPTNGLTPPHKKKAPSRFISDVIVEMGFLARDRVDAAVEEGKASGRSPEQVLLEDLGVTQAPAIVIIGRSGKAKLVEGYIDGPSLVQVVADAR